MAELFIDLVTSLRPVLPSLLVHPHASPPVRVLLLVLSPGRALPELGGGEGGVRSKKSGKFRKNHSVKGQSFLDEDGDAKDKGKGKGEGEKVVKRDIPEAVAGLRSEIRKGLMQNVRENEWRIIGVDLAGSVAVQVSCIRADKAHWSSCCLTWKWRMEKQRSKGRYWTISQKV